MRRLAVMAALVLVGGLVVNVLVAWGCTLWIDVACGAFSYADDGVHRSGRFTRSGAAYYESIRPGRARVMPTAVDPDALLPHWTGLREPSADYAAGNLVSEYRIVDVRGWPLPALWMEFRAPLAPGALTVHGGLRVEGLPFGSDVLGGRSRYGSTSPKALPLRPRWPGLVLNTLIYAVVLGVLLAPAWQLRQTLRRRRGHCPACGYDLHAAAGEVCPECGEPRPRPRRAIAADPAR